MTSADRPRVAVIGLGVMGEAMAANVARGGLDVAVYDLRPEPVQRLVDAGATAAASVEDAARDADIVLIVVVDEKQADGVLVGSSEAPGVFASAKPGTAVLVHSTIGVAAIRRLAGSGAERGIEVVDAPITGAPAGARAGTLTVIAGGDAAVIERCRPVLDLIAKQVVQVGGIGAGQLAKVANNLVFAATLNGVHEALALGGEVGLDAAALLKILSSGAAQSWIVDNWSAIGESSRNYPGGPAGVAQLTHKDLALALAVGREHGVTLPATALATQLLGGSYQAAAEHPNGAARPA